MTSELIISLVSLVLSTACSMMTVFVTLKVGKLNNLEAIHKYQKEITPFELTFKTKEWFLDLMNSGEFSKYSESSKQIMIAWWKKINQEEAQKKQQEQVPLTKHTKTTTKTGRTGKGNSLRIPNLPTGRGEMFGAGIPIEVVIPGKEGSFGSTAPESVHKDTVIEDTIAEFELDFDTLLDTNINNILK